jgi:hypothetical protein
MPDSAAKWIAGTIVLLSIGYSVGLGLTQANPLVGLIAGLFSGTLFGLGVASLVLLAIGVWRKIFSIACSLMHCSVAVMLPTAIRP